MTDKKLEIVRYLDRLDKIDKYLEQQLEKNCKEGHLTGTVRKLYTEILDCHYQVNKVIREAAELGQEVQVPVKKKELPGPFPDIIRIVEEVTDMEYPGILSHSTRKREVVDARIIASMMLRKYYKMPYTQIGRKFRLDHTSIISACKRGKKLLEAGDLAFCYKYFRVEKIVEEAMKSEDVEVSCITPITV